YWRKFCHEWLLSLGIKDEHLRLRDHEPEKLAFYSKATTDFEYLFPFGWGELWGVADRTDYDLKQHSEHSGKAMEYLDPTTGEKFIPYCIEPSLGVDRMVLTLLCEAYEEQELEGGDVRNVLHLHPFVAPYKAAVLPLQKNKLGDKAKEVYTMLSKYFMVEYDETGSIGKRYRRADEAGTPMCITIDFDTLETGKVTVRDRDTMQQESVAIDDLKAYIEKKIEF
ncbi:MAG: glycine--tRNA ligase, partial [Clostridia bacterium]|nr:glycine--tRNA ligase [Clostridia bacterium]